MMEKVVLLCSWLLLIAPVRCEPAGEVFVPQNMVMGGGDPFVQAGPTLQAPSLEQLVNWQIQQRMQQQLQQQQQQQQPQQVLQQSLQQQQPQQVLQQNQQQPRLMQNDPVVTSSAFTVRAPGANVTSSPLIPTSAPPTVTGFFGAKVNAFISKIIAFLGALLGRDGCDLKAACLLGSFMPRIQGRDMAMVAAESVVPDNWKAAYQAARSSMIQGQDCERYKCF